MEQKLAHFDFDNIRKYSIEEFELLMSSAKIDSDTLKNVIIISDSIGGTIDNTKTVVRIAKFASEQNINLVFQSELPEKELCKTFEPEPIKILPRYEYEEKVFIDDNQQTKIEQLQVQIRQSLSITKKL